MASERAGGAPRCPHMSHLQGALQDAHVPALLPRHVLAVSAPGPGREARVSLLQGACPRPPRAPEREGYVLNLSSK